MSDSSRKVIQYVKAGSNMLRAAISRDTVQRKRHAELAFWNQKAANDPTLESDHYEYFYTEHFGLRYADYSGAKVLDIGCGPRGSLEWADMADQRVGLDPLVDDYREMGVQEHEMEYVCTGAEDIPFNDGYFDIITSFNSLDHVDDLKSTVSEIKRVAGQEGLFLLITDVGHDPTFTEPLNFEWDVVDRFSPEFEVKWEDHREKSEGQVYASARDGETYDHDDPSDRYGVLSAKFQRV